MGRTKKRHQSLMKDWLSTVTKPEHFTIDGSQIFCQPCGTSYTFKQSCQLSQHSETVKHQANAKRFDAKPEKQQLLTEGQTSRNVYYEDLCEAFIAADIPWAKINNPTLTSFLQKYTKLNQPDESTLRKNYLQKVYSKAMDNIREEIGDNSIWLAIDESTDAKGRYMANVLVGALRKNRPSASHIVSVVQLDKVNSSTVSQLVLDTLNKLWPGESQAKIDGKFLLLLSDGVNYMKKSGKTLQRTYPKLIHSTCVIHALHLIAEKVRTLFPVVDKLIGAVKAVFRKAPCRVLKYKSMLPDVPLPPQPILTRWGTWMEAVSFYCDHFTEVKSVIDTFDEDDAVCIANAKQAFETSNLSQQLAYISAHYSFIPTSIEQLEADGLSLLTSVEILTDFENKINRVPGTAGEEVKLKLTYLLNKNKGLQDMKIVAEILKGEEDNPDRQAISEKYGPTRIANFTYAPLSTCEVERSFSTAKTLLSDRRMRLTPENIEKMLISHYELSHRID